MNKAKACLTDYFKVTLPLVFVFCLLRVYEYCTSGIKLSISDNVFLVLSKGWYFDVFTWFIYSLLLLLPYLLVYWVNRKAATTFLKIVNSFTILGFFGLLVVYSERMVPFDHELFVRTPADSFSTMKEVFFGRFWDISPVFAYLALYWTLCYWPFSKLRADKWNRFAIPLAALSVLSTVLMQYSAPSAKNYEQVQEYYLVSNKLNYFASDCYTYLFRKSNLDARLATRDDVLREINYYQQNTKFNFVNKEYPLLHLDESKNVLKAYLRQSDTLPNIVIIIYESLTRDFSGKDAEIGSFTPFLDSLSDHSLSWYNCLSTADGTFGSMPSILGSLPFGPRGFTLLDKPTDHISLVKILKKNNYSSYYFAGGDMNYDNFGGFMGLQGTDYMSVEFGPKYKKMGVGPEGLSEGFPDDALFNRSLEMLDLIGKEPYLSVYLTLTTHTPFVFDQMNEYAAFFERELIRRKLSDKQKRNLRLYRPMLASFLFTDNCMRDFFARYKKRPDYKNTIFVIVGDHHHGAYPTRNIIDDYNVPLIIYSPMLTKSVRFNSVNSHLNIAPTLLAYLKDSYHIKYTPRYVPWMGDVLDTCVSFRNIHRFPFMLCNRNIDDYVYDNFYIAQDQLYELKPGLNLKPIDNPAIFAKISRQRENFKLINSYVCKNNKLYPASENIYDVKKTELYAFIEKAGKEITPKTEYLCMVKGFKPPPKYREIMVKISFMVKFDTAIYDMLPLLATGIYGFDNKKQLFYGGKYLKQYIVKPNKDGWIPYSDDDIYNLDNFPDPNGHYFRFEFWNEYGVSMKYKDFSIKFLGIE
jgi:phosphoglycerol transferase MdoB-like AlkP superfamily enzyme